MALEALISSCAGGNSGDERKITCEERLDETKDDEYEFKEPGQMLVPLESFWLSKDAEIDWFDQNAFFQRTESTKGISNSMYLNPNMNPASNSNSQRFSSNFKSRASILGLPKLQKTSFVDTKNRRTCKPGNARWIPKRSGSVAKSDSSLVEPSSPKVSCMGRVKSKRNRSRRRKNRHQSLETAKAKEESAKKGFLANFFALFRSSCKQSAPVAVSPPRKSSAAREVPPAVENKAQSSESLPRKSTESEPPGLSGMNRFASGRRSAAWGVNAAE